MYSAEPQPLAFLLSAIGLPLCYSEHVPLCSTVINPVKLLETHPVREIEYIVKAHHLRWDSKKWRGKKNPQQRVQIGMCKKLWTNMLGKTSVQTDLQITNQELVYWKLLFFCSFVCFHYPIRYVSLEEVSFIHKLSYLHSSEGESCDNFWRTEHATDISFLQERTHQSRCIHLVYWFFFPCIIKEMKDFYWDRLLLCISPASAGPYQLIQKALKNALLSSSTALCIVSTKHKFFHKLLRWSSYTTTDLIPSSQKPNLIVALGLLQLLHLDSHFQMKTAKISAAIADKRTSNISLDYNKEFCSAGNVRSRRLIPVFEWHSRPRSFSNIFPRSKGTAFIPFLLEESVCVTWADCIF